MITTVMASEEVVTYFFSDFHGGSFAISAPHNITGLQLKDAIQQETNIPMDHYNLINSVTSDIVTDDESNFFRKNTNQHFFLVLKPKANSPTDTIKVSFLGIVGDLQLELPHEATIKNLHDQLSTQPALQGQYFALAVNNMIFTNNSTPLVNYRNQQFQILTFQPQN